MKPQFQLKKFQKFIYKEIIEIEEVFKKFLFQLEYKQSDKEHSYFWFVYEHKEISLRKVSLFLSPKTKHFDSEFYHSKRSALLDSQFSFTQYLKYKKRPYWCDKIDLTTKDIYELFRIFKKELIQALKEDGELRGIISGQSCWRNPPLEGIPRTNIKRFETEIDKIFFNEPPSFKKTGLLLREKKMTLTQSDITDYKDYKFEYLYINYKSDIRLKISIRPKFSATLNDIAIVSHIQKGDEDSISNSIHIEDYLKFKKHLELLKVLRSFEGLFIESSEKDLYIHVKLFLNLICDLFVIDPKFLKIIQGKFWPMVQSQLKMEFFLDRALEISRVQNFIKSVPLCVARMKAVLKAAKHLSNEIKMDFLNLASNSPDCEIRISVIKIIEKYLSSEKKKVEFFKKGMNGLFEQDINDKYKDIYVQIAALEMLVKCLKSEKEKLEFLKQGIKNKETIIRKESIQFAIRYLQSEKWKIKFLNKGIRDKDENIRLVSIKTVAKRLKNNEKKKELLTRGMKDRSFFVQDTANRLFARIKKKEVNETRTKPN